MIVASPIKINENKQIESPKKDNQKEEEDITKVLYENSKEVRERFR